MNYILRSLYSIAHTVCYMLGVMASDLRGKVREAGDLPLKDDFPSKANSKVQYQHPEINPKKPFPREMPARPLTNNSVHKI